MTTEHTPLPWIWNEFEQLVGADGSKIIETDDGYYPPTQADRDFIDTAVHAHDDLVKALQEFMSLDKTFSTVCDAALNEMAANGTRLAQSVLLARAALEKAGAA